MSVGSLDSVNDLFTISVELFKNGFLGGYILYCGLYLFYFLLRIIYEGWGKLSIYVKSLKLKFL